MLREAALRIYCIPKNVNKYQLEQRIILQRESSYNKNITLHLR